MHAVTSYAGSPTSRKSPPPRTPDWCGHREVGDADGLFLNMHAHLNHGDPPALSGATCIHVTLVSADCCRLCLACLDRQLAWTGIDGRINVRDILPSLLGVPILTFGFLMIWFPRRLPYAPSLAASRSRCFQALWVGALLTSVMCECLQTSGTLVFDRHDLYAVGVGGIFTLLLFAALRMASFQSAE